MSERLVFVGGGGSFGYYDWQDQVNGKHVRATVGSGNTYNVHYDHKFVAYLEREGSIGNLSYSPRHTPSLWYLTNTSSLCTAVGRLLDNERIGTA